MSKRINVNPDHYKVGGREKQGNPIGKARESQAITRDVRWEKRSRKAQVTGRKSR